MARIVRADGDQAEIEGPAGITDLFEGGADGVTVAVCVVVFAGGQVWHGAIAGVAAEPDALAAALDAPAGPQGLFFVEGGSSAGVLAGETADLELDVGKRCLLRLPPV